VNINLTEDEYRTLLEVLQVADWVLNANKVDDDPRTREYRALEQKVFSSANEAGCGDLIEYVPEEELFLPTQQFDEESPVMEFIEEYDDGVFWDQLAERLAYRDLVEAEGEKKLERMPEDERFDRIEDLSETYLEEFYKRGLERLRFEE
jgi:hypothetical protein